MDPEYRSIPSSRGFELIQPALIDSEYQSDLLIYSMSPQQVAEWGAAILRGWNRPESSGEFFLSAGSLSATQFDFRSRALIRARLVDGLGFQFLRSEEENYEESSSHSIVELEQRLGQSELSLAAFGEIGRLKKEDDVGFALLHRSDDRQAMSRLSLMFPDFTRSERNDLGDRFETGAEPLVVSFVHRQVSAQVYREFSARIERPTRWLNPSAGTLYTYSQLAFGGTVVASGFGSLRGQFDRKETAVETTASRVWQTVIRDRLELDARHEVVLGGDARLEMGAAWVSRHWHDQLARRFMQQTLQPFLWWKHDSGAELGWETSFSRAYGDSALAAPMLRWSAEESRLNARYRWRFRERGELLLALTFDADGADGGVFEGGHGQFALAF